MEKVKIILLAPDSGATRIRKQH